MNVQSFDPMRRIAEQVADCFSGSGYAFVEDDKLEALAAVLRSFLLAAEIPVNEPGGATPPPPPYPTRRPTPHT